MNEKKPYVLDNGFIEIVSKKLTKDKGWLLENLVFNSLNGNYDFDVGIIAKNSSELREFINELRDNFYEEIKIYDTFLVLDEVSSQKLPLIVFE